MTTVYSRLNLNFDTTRFGDAHNISSGASNTLNTIAVNTPAVPTWAITDLAAGSISRSSYFQNPTTSNIQSMLVYAANIVSSALTTNNFTVSAAANNLIIELNAFQSHTDNISGVATVTDTTVPGYDTASAIGQQTLMILSKTDGSSSTSNTDPILGSFTSLFIPDILQANTNQLNIYKNEMYANSLGTIISPTELQKIANYANSTTLVLNTRRTSDWTFFQNSFQVVKDYGFLQQFGNMGGTNTYLVNNVIGTPSLVTKINS